MFHGDEPHAGRGLRTTALKEHSNFLENRLILLP